MQSGKPKKKTEGAPQIRYINSLTGCSLSYPEGLEFPLLKTTTMWVCQPCLLSRCARKKKQKKSCHLSSICQKAFKIWFCKRIKSLSNCFFGQYHVCFRNKETTIAWRTVCGYSEIINVPMYDYMWVVCVEITIFIFEVFGFSKNVLKSVKGQRILWRKSFLFLIFGEFHVSKRLNVNLCFQQAGLSKLLPSFSMEERPVKYTTKTSWFSEWRFDIQM